MSPTKAAEREEKKRRQRKWDTVYNLAAWALSLASWGYTVIAPEPSLLAGTALLLAATAVLAAAVSRALELQAGGVVLTILIMLAVFGVFDYKVLYVPHRDKEIRALLTLGYHTLDDCSWRPYHEQTPSWMQDEQERWMGASSQFIESRLDLPYIQMWNESVIYGNVKDKDENGYRCSLVAAKVEALETIVAKAYNEKIQHQEYTGPKYVFTHDPANEIQVPPDLFTQPQKYK